MTLPSSDFDNIPVVDGMFQTPRIKSNRIVSLEHGNLKSVRGIVLHQTDSDYKRATLDKWEIHDWFYRHHNHWIFKKLANMVNGDENGAHFLIGPNGTIYQTASVNKMCYHVGNYVRARCMEFHEPIQLNLRAKSKSLPG